MCEEAAQDPYLYILKLYVQYLKGLFNFMSTGEFHWEPDDEVSEIIIRGEAPLNPEVVGKKPAITVVLGPSQFQGIGIDNLVSQELSTGVKIHTDLMSGFIVVYCLAESDTTAMRIAHMVANFTRAQRNLLESPGGFHAIARPAATINSPSPPGALIAGDPIGLIMVQVNIPFQFQWTWKVTPKQLRSLRSLDLITKERRASDYEYASPVRLERVELAMSTAPVYVRRIGGRFAIRPQEIAVTQGISPFQKTSLRPFGEEE
jgi:hypothetical protein